MTLIRRKSWVPIPTLGTIFGTPAFGASAACAATGDKLAVCGFMKWDDGQTHSIHTVEWLFDAIVKAGGSGLTGSIQALSTATSPLQPSGTQLATFAVANGNASFASNTWIAGAALSVDVSTPEGTGVAFVLEYDGGGRLGADTFKLRGITSGIRLDIPAFSADTAGTWATTGSTVAPIVIFKSNDGHVGTLHGIEWIGKTITSITFNSGTNPNEQALQFTEVAAGKIDGCWFALTGAAAATVTFGIYKGTTLINSVTVDGHEWGEPGSARMVVVPLPETPVAVGDVISISVLPTNATNTTVFAITANAAGDLACLDLGTGLTRATRNGGAWTAVSADRLIGGLRYSAVDDGTGTGSPSARAPQFVGYTD